MTGRKASPIYFDEVIASHSAADTHGTGHCSLYLLVIVYDEGISRGGYCDYVNVANETWSIITITSTNTDKKMKCDTAIENPAQCLGVPR